MKNPTTVERTSERELAVTRTFSGPAHIVFEAWTVDPISGDFGVDLLARKNGLTYAIQCKCYVIPVGISAVQEAAAGRLHYMTDYAVVVANSGFTTQARRLAESNSVLLIGSAQLTGLQELSISQDRQDVRRSSTQKGTF